MKSCLRGTLLKRAPRGQPSKPDCGLGALRDPDTHCIFCERPVGDSVPRPVFGWLRFLEFSEHVQWPSPAYSPLHYHAAREPDRHRRTDSHVYGSRLGKRSALLSMAKKWHQPLGSDGSEL